MLKIKISAFHLTIPADAVELVKQHANVQKFENVNGDYRIYDQPENLYKILYDLSKHFDIELM